MDAHQSSSGQGSSKSGHSESDLAPTPTPTSTMSLELNSFIEEAASEMPLPPKGKYCCVVGCHNNQGREGRGGSVRFFSFPKDPERRHLWLKAVNRTVPNKPYELWQAKAHDVICSVHFEGGKKSNNKKDVSYVPSIFPTHSVSGKKESDSARDSRYERRCQKPVQNEKKQSLMCPRTMEVLTGSMTDAEDMSQVTDMDVDSCSLMDTDSTHHHDTNTICLDYAVQVNLSETECDHLVFCDVVSSTDKSTQMSTFLSSPSSKKRESECQTDSMPSINFSALSVTQSKALFGVEPAVIRFLVLRTQGLLKETRRWNRTDKIRLLLMRLKLLMPFAALAAIFDVGVTTTKDVFKETLTAVFEVARGGLIWFDRPTVQARMPPSFRALFPETRAIIDCSEIQCERPAKLRQRVLSYSNYKSNFTLKFLVAIAPSGEIMFVSRTWGGRTTDTDITCNSNFLELIEEGDLILADKGFPVIEHGINKAGGLLVMPPFKQGERQLTGQQNKEGYKCAKVRVHVERAIRRLKHFEALSFVPMCMMPHIDKSLVIICFLSNLLTDLIKVE